MQKRKMIKQVFYLSSKISSLEIRPPQAIRRSGCKGCAGMLIIHVTNIEEKCIMSLIEKANTIMYIHKKPLSNTYTSMTLYPMTIFNSNLKIVKIKMVCCIAPAGDLIFFFFYTMPLLKNINLYYFQILNTLEVVENINRKIIISRILFRRILNSIKTN